MKKILLLLVLLIGLSPVLQAQQIENNTACAVVIGIQCYNPGSCTPTTFTSITVPAFTTMPYTLCPGGPQYTQFVIAFDPPSCKNGSLRIASPGNCMGSPSSGMLSSVGACNCTNGGPANVFFATTVNIRINP